MKKTSIIIVIILFTNILNTYCQYTLTVEFTALRNNNGNVLYELFDAKQKSLKVGTIDIANNKAVVVFENLKSAKYGVNFIHDENKNKKLDTKMLMIPKEGFGYSNNPTVKFGPPAYEKWIFEVKENTKITCKTTYLNY